MCERADSCAAFLVASVWPVCATALDVHRSVEHAAIDAIFHLGNFNPSCTFFFVLEPNMAGCPKAAFLSPDFREHRDEPATVILFHQTPTQVPAVSLTFGDEEHIHLSIDALKFYRSNRCLFRRGTTWFVPTAPVLQSRMPQVLDSELHVPLHAPNSLSASCICVRQRSSESSIGRSQLF